MASCDRVSRTPIAGLKKFGSAIGVRFYIDECECRYVENPNPEAGVEPPGARRTASWRPQLRETGISCRLGSDRTRAIPTSKSQIVGIPPFLNCVKNTGRGDVCPLQAPTSKKRAYLPVGVSLEVDHSDTRITNRWKIAIFETQRRIKNGRPEVLIVAVHLRCGR